MLNILSYVKEYISCMKIKFKKFKCHSDCLCSKVDIDIDNPESDKDIDKRYKIGKIEYSFHSKTVHPKN